MIEIFFQLKQQVDKYREKRFCTRPQSPMARRGRAPGFKKENLITYNITLLTFEEYMCLTFEEQVTEIETNGKPTGVYQENGHEHSILYTYNHFHVEVTYLKMAKAESIVPLLVLNEFEEIARRYSVASISGSANENKFPE